METHFSKNKITALFGKADNHKSVFTNLLLSRIPIVKLLFYETNSKNIHSKKEQNCPLLTTFGVLLLLQKLIDVWH